jgi:hypothetical protein
VLCDLVLSAWKSARRGPILAAAAGALYGLMFLTAFQASWFFAFYLLLMALLYPAVFGRRATRALFGEAVTRRTIILAAGAGFAAGIVPFLVLYVPVFLAGHSRSFAEVAGNMPLWRDLLNVTPENGIWGALSKRLGIAGRPDRPVWEVELAFTPVVPGAKAIRYTFRSQLVANLFVSLIVARTLAMLARRIAVVVLAAVLIAEQINLVWPATMSRKTALAWIDAAPPPPAGCRAFYVVPGAGPPERSGPQHQDDAMLFAQLRGIPTLNGYSSWFPDGWALDEPASPGYRAAVRAWAEKNRIADEVCGLEPRTGRWVVGLP